jgi:predicted methyltransferase
MKSFIASFVAALTIIAAGCAAQPSRSSAAAELDRIVASDHRSAENQARDRFRHPKETLKFFGVRPDMTVVEVWPGSGWYTEILAPLVRDSGRLYAAQLDPAGGEYAKKTVDAFAAKLSARPDLYDKVIVTTLATPPAKSEIAPANSVDMVLTFRNLHNWMMFNWQREALQSMFIALKPGGVLGVVEHRGNPKLAQDPRAASGYVNEAYAIELIESVGFKLVDRSEINANAADTKDYEKGVWTLPPSYALDSTQRERYERIGESDRFTLKFIKPKDAAKASATK